MLNQLLIGGLVSLANFGIHALMTGLIVVLTRHVAGRTDDLHVFMRVSALMMVAVCVLMLAHVAEISVWAALYALAGIETEKAGSFDVDERISQVRSILAFLTRHVPGVGTDLP